MGCTYYNCTGILCPKHICEKKFVLVTSGHKRAYCASGILYDICPNYGRTSNNDCFFTTIIVERLGYPADDKTLSAIKEFRINVLEKDPKYNELLALHDIISPLISNDIRQTMGENDDEFIGKVVYQKHLLQLASFITNKQYERAVDSYERLLELLNVKYGSVRQYSSERYQRNLSTQLMRPKLRIRRPQRGKRLYTVKLEFSK